MKVRIDDLQSEAVIRLLQQHLDDMHAISPPGSVHALDIDRLRQPDITFWSIRDNDQPVGCIALQTLDPGHGEIKSLRTAAAFRGQGAGKALLQHLLQAARQRQLTRLSLETGASAFFEPARRLYARFGFTRCEPFADYQNDPHSVFMTKML